jgi:hypothetical protein
MSMQARTLRILEEANFTRPQALALAEAIEGEIHGGEIVTIPILDSRLSGLRGDMAGIENRLELKLAATDKHLAAMEGRLEVELADTGSSLRLLISDTEGRLKLSIANVEDRLFYKTASLGLAATGLIITAVFFLVQNLKK